MAFRIKFPKTYAHNIADGKVYPSIILLHGLGESGNVWDNEYQLLNGGQYHAQKIDDGTKPLHTLLACDESALNANNNGHHSKA